MVIVNNLKLSKFFISKNRQNKGINRHIFKIILYETLNHQIDDKMLNLAAMSVMNVLKEPASPSRDLYKCKYRCFIVVVCIICLHIFL